MEIISRGRMDLAKQTDEQRAARERMAHFPENGEVLYVDRDLWVVRLLVFKFWFNLVWFRRRSDFIACGSTRREIMHPTWDTGTLPATP